AQHARRRAWRSSPRRPGCGRSTVRSSGFAHARRKAAEKSRNLPPEAVLRELLERHVGQRAELAQEAEGVDSRPVAIRPGQAHRVIADLLDVAQLRAALPFDEEDRAVVALAVRARAESAQNRVSVR